MVSVLIEHGKALHISGEQAPETVVTVEQTLFCGYEVTITKFRGMETFRERRETKDGRVTERTVVADSATFIDGGKHGVSSGYILHKDYTDAERAEGRRRIQAVVTQAMVEQGIW